MEDESYFTGEEDTTESSPNTSDEASNQSECETNQAQTKPNEQTIRERHIPSNRAIIGKNKRISKQPSSTPPMEEECKPARSVQTFFQTFGALDRKAGNTTNSVDAFFKLFAPSSENQRSSLKTWNPINNSAIVQSENNRREILMNRMEPETIIESDGDVFAGMLSLYVAGLSPATDDNSFRRYFSQFGDITDSCLNQDTGVGFISFSRFHKYHPLIPNTHKIDGK